MQATADKITKLTHGLGHEDTGVRLRAALTAGTYPDTAFVEMLVERCGIEEDFFVRDMLTWALIHHDADDVLPKLRVDLHSAYPQARGQALHTLSKIGHPEAWEWITTDHLHDADVTVARPAWRAAVAVVPADRVEWLATELVQELGRGDHDAMRGLAQAMMSLGAKFRDPADDAPSVIEPLLAGVAATAEDPVVRAHAEAILRWHLDPTTPFSLTESESIG